MLLPELHTINLCVSAGDSDILKSQPGAEAA